MTSKTVFGPFYVQKLFFYFIIFNEVSVFIISGRICMIQITTQGIHVHNVAVYDFVSLIMALKGSYYACLSLSTYKGCCKVRLLF